MTDNPDQSSAEPNSEEDARHILIDLRDFRQQKDPPPVTFHRRELDAILRLYGRMVADGEWRDYALDHLEDRAVFSIFRRASEMPMYRVEKVPALARKQGAYRVLAASGLILKRGHELANVLKVLDKPKLSLV
jgi:hypothetical protein